MIRLLDGLIDRWTDRYMHNDIYIYIYIYIAVNNVEKSDNTKKN